MNKIPNNIDSPLIKIYIYIFFRTQHLIKKKKNQPLHQKRKRKKKKPINWDKTS